MRFSEIVLPPFEKGIMWSTTSFAPSCGVLPQYWQVKLSLLKISNLVRKFALWLFSGFPIQVGLVGRLTSLSALPQVPKRFSYMLQFGKSSNLFTSRLLTKPPSKTAASFSFSKSSLSEISEYLVTYFFFIAFIIRDYLIKVK